MPITRCGRVARGYRRKRFYSTPSRILTHLSATAAHEPVTLSVLTQEGIAASTHSGRTTATKWLARLEASGLVAGERAHVPGHRVRKTVYRLSHEGWVEAMKVRARLKTDIVEVVAPALDPTPMRVSDIPEIFPAYVNLTAAVSLIRRGRLDFTKLQGIGSGAAGPIPGGTRSAGSAASSDAPTSPAPSIPGPPRRPPYSSSRESRGSARARSSRAGSCASDSGRTSTGSRSTTGRRGPRSFATSRRSSHGWDAAA